MISTAIKGQIGRVGGAFMISREVKALCERSGLEGRPMYFRGRCGVLGDCHPDVVVAASVFWDPAHAAESWEAGRSLPAAEAVAGYARACQEWGRRRLSDFDGASRLAELLERVVNNASVLGAPLFAGWRAVPLPDDAPARSYQLTHVLRELRGGAHAIAVLAYGIDPLDATLVGSEGSGTPVPVGDAAGAAGFLGWEGPFGTPSPEVVARRAKAEDMTDELVEPAFDVLDAGERAELIRLVGAAHQVAYGS